jgi:DNA adenine methylase
MTNNSSQIVRSPIRWAGSKYTLLPQILDLFPRSFSCYFEPMVGGGAVFFSSKVSNALISDMNPDLINYYIVLRDYRTDFIDFLLTLKSSKEKYYEFREKQPIESFESAVRFAYLNRLSWNGIYRVNQNGLFNVPFGGRTPSRLWSKEHLLKCSKRLSYANVICADFKITLMQCQKNDFVFIDPPYPKSANSGLGFNRYVSVPFSLNHHIELAELIFHLSEKKIKVMLTLGENEEILKLYPKSFKIKKVITKSLISCDGTSRGNITEYILRNYKN